MGPPTGRSGRNTTDEGGRETSHCISFYDFGFLNHVNELAISYLKKKEKKVLLRAEVHVGANFIYRSRKAYCVWPTGP